MKKIDVYDFDKTLYKKDSSIQFFLYCMKVKPIILKYVPGILFHYVLYFFKLIKKEKLKEYYFKFLGEFKNIDKIVRDFWKKHKKYIRVELLDNNKNEVVVISASPEFLLKDICEEYKINKVIASKVDIKTGKFNSLNCYRKEKLNRLNKEYKNYVIENFYSDSYSDDALAQKSNNAYIINNNEVSNWNFNKFSRFINTIINNTYTIMMFIIIICCIFFTNRLYACKKIFQFTNAFSIFIGLIVFVILLYLLKKVLPTKIKRKHIHIFMIVFSIILIFLLYFRAKNFWFLSGWDAGSVRYNSFLIATDNFETVDNNYFSIFPNNIFMTIIFSWIVRLSNLFNVVDYNSSLLFFNCTLYSLTGLFLYFNIYKLSKENHVLSVFGYLIYLLLIGLSPWVVIPYSDSLGLFIIMLEVFLFLKYTEKQEQKMKYLYFMLLCLTSLFGLKIKPQIFLFFISFMLVTISDINYKNIKSLISKDTLIYILMAIMSIISVSTVFNYYQNKYFDIDEEKKFGIANYLMWGINYRSRGVWPAEDVSYSLSFNTAAERTKGNLKVVKERIEYLGISGILDLYTDKILTNFNDGTFAWEAEGDFYIQIYNTGNEKYMNTLKNYYYCTGVNSWIYWQTMQIIWITILFLNLVLSIKKDSKKEINILKLTIIGLFIFQLLFEARARYVLSNAPILIILMCISLSNFKNNPITLDNSAKNSKK